MTITPFADAKPGELYQLVFQGALERQRDKPSETYLHCYFRATDWEQNPKEPLGEYIVRKINLHQGSGLQVGSLWKSTGERAASSRMRLPHTKKFTLKPGTLTPRRLSDILPTFDDDGLAPLTAFLSEPLFTSFKGTPFVTIEHRTTTILLSCFELARAFYLWAGPRIVDFFFYPGAIQDLCYPVVPPTSRNRKSARLLLHCRNREPALHDLPRHFTPEQVAILAELLFNPSFNKSFTQLRAKLLTRWAQSPIAQLWLHLTLEKAVQVEANGIPFEYDGRPYFWVTSLIKRSNYFCFNKLTYTSLDDHRPGRTAARAEFHAELDRLRAHADWQAQPTPVADSDYAGSSLYGDHKVSLLTDEEVLMPQITRTEKVLQDMVWEATYRHIYGSPSILSERGGGRDLDVAKAFFHLEKDKVTYAWYFHAMVAEFRRFHITVKCLETNNEKQTFGPEVCVLLSSAGNPYRAGIAEILYEHRYFYFIQVLASRSKRWAFLYKATNQVTWSQNQVHDILLAIRAAKDDWVLAKTRYQERLTRKFADPLTIIPHNRISIVSDLKRCQSDMRAQLRVKYV